MTTHHSPLHMTSRICPHKQSYSNTAIFIWVRQDFVYCQSTKYRN